MEKYRYLDFEGNCKGPYWLTQMREFYHSGRLPASTQVCRVGDETWGALQEFGEIVLKMDAMGHIPTPRKQQKEPVRLLLLVWLLFGLFLAWQILH